MQIVLFIVARMVQLTLGFIELALLLRAILSWFVRNEENRFMMILYTFTEPAIFPFRVLCRTVFHVPEEFPLDIPFTMTFLSVTILNGILPQVTL